MTFAKPGTGYRPPPHAARRVDHVRATTARAAGVTDRLWSMEDVVALVEAAAEPPKRRGPYKPRQPKEA